MTSRTRVPKRHEQILKTMGPNLAGRHSRSSLSACQQKPRGSENHQKGYQNPSQIHPKSRKSAPGRRLRNHLKIDVRFIAKIMKMTSQREPQRRLRGFPLGENSGPKSRYAPGVLKWTPKGRFLEEIRGAEGRSGPGPLQDLQNGAQKGGF